MWKMYYTITFFPWIRSKWVVMKPHTHKGLVVALVLAGPWPGSCCPGSRHFRSSGPRAYGDTFQVKIVAGVVVRLDTPLFSQALAAFSSPSSTTVFFHFITAHFLRRFTLYLLMLCFGSMQCFRLLTFHIQHFINCVLYSRGLSWSKFLFKVLWFNDESPKQ